MMATPRPPNPQNSSSSSSRVWRACGRCRIRKIKCDGRDPCATCEAQFVTCTFSPANDNAANNRQPLPAFEERFRRVDLLCEKAEALLGRLSIVADALDQTRANDTTSFVFSQGSVARSELGEPVKIPDIFDLHMAADGNEGGSDDDEDEDNNEGECRTSSAIQGQVAMDSYGRFRYVGGAPNMLLIDAVRAISEAAEDPVPTVLTPAASPSSPPTRGKYLTAPLPFFTPGIVWPRLPYLPRPDQVPRPPRYIVDLLVNIFFDQVHYTFPILYQPQFMRQYYNLMSERPNTRPDSGFLSVFFAVCAYSSSLMDHGTGQRFPGMEYYEKAILLHYAGAGQATIEQVQCLALLALCAARWNTLAQSWKFTGQAVRAAQDLGFHVGFCSVEADVNEMVARERTRRIWWAVSTLDCVVSLSLGRPIAGLDSDDTCPLPLDLWDNEIEAYSEKDLTRPRCEKVGGLAGFIAFARLCRISCRIYHLCQKESRLRQNHVSAKSKLLRQWQRLQKQLEEWMLQLPSSISVSPETMRSRSESTASRTMSVIIAVMHSSAVIHLQGKSLPPFTEDGSLSDWPSSSDLVRQQIIQAAQDCIQASEFLHTHVPPSHYLAFGVHQLTLSGLLLLRTSSSKPPPPDTIDVVQSCINIMSTLEASWSAAQHNKVILQSLLNFYTNNHMGNSMLEDLNCPLYAASLFPLTSPSSLAFDTPLNIENFFLNEVSASITATWPKNQENE